MKSLSNARLTEPTNHLRRYLGRALDSFPVPVRTLDALRVASAEYLRQHGQEIQVAHSDAHMIEGARRLGLVV